MSLLWLLFTSIFIKSSNISFLKDKGFSSNVFPILTFMLLLTQLEFCCPWDISGASKFKQCCSVFLNQSEFIAK